MLPLPLSIIIVISKWVIDTMFLYMIWLCLGMSDICVETILKIVLVLIQRLVLILRSTKPFFSLRFFCSFSCLMIDDGYNSMMPYRLIIHHFTCSHIRPAVYMDGRQSTQTHTEMLSILLNGSPSNALSNLKSSSQILVFENRIRFRSVQTGWSSN